MKKLIILSLLLTGCVPPLTKEEASVKLATKGEVQGCEQLTRIAGGIGEGMMDADRLENSKKTARGLAASQGATHYVIDGMNAYSVAGYAYRCPATPGASPPQP